MTRKHRNSTAAETERVKCHVMKVNNGRRLLMFFSTRQKRDSFSFKPTAVCRRDMAKTRYLSKIVCHGTHFSFKLRISLPTF